MLNGVAEGDSSAGSVSGGQDFDGDGIADLLIGAERAYRRGIEQAGASYVVFGRAASPP